MNFADELELRAMTPDDKSFVLSSWLRSYARKGPDAKLYEPRPIAGQEWDPPRAFFDDYSPVAIDLVARSTVIVAGLRGIADSIVAWYALEGDTLHYILVKSRFRRLGVAKWLIGDAALQPLSYSHRVQDMESRRDERTGERLPPKVRVPKAWTYRRFRIWPHQEAAA